MSDTILTITQVEDLFQNLTLNMLGLDPAAKKNQSRVRISWPTKGAPAWKISEDVIFLLINFDDDAITRQVDVSYTKADDENANRSMSYTRVLRIDWICYGPNSSNDADTIRSSLFLPQFTQKFAANNLALITDVPMPIRSPELFNGQWWDRSSLYARFNEKVVRTTEVPYLKSADVQIVKG